MVCSIAFSHAPGGTFLVLLECPGEHEPPPVTLTSFPDENEFIQNVVLGLSCNDTIMTLIAHLLLSLSGQVPAAQWLSVDIPASELNMLDLTIATCSCASLPQPLGLFGEHPAS